MRAQSLQELADMDGRIVSTNDLDQFQILEADADGRMYVDARGHGWVCLPWEFTTDKDREREKKYLNEHS